MKYLNYGKLFETEVRLLNRSSHFNLVDSKLWGFLTKTVDLMILSFWWVVGSLLIVTAGASSAALYHSVHKTVWQDEGHPTQEFWSAYKQDLKQGSLISLFFLLAAGFAVFAWYFADYVGKDTFLGSFYQVVVVLIALLGLILALYIFPILSRYTVKTATLFAASFSLAVTHFVRTLALLVLAAISILGLLLMPPLLLLLPGVYMFSIERLMEPVLNEILPGEQV